MALPVASGRKLAPVPAPGDVELWRRVAETVKPLPRRHPAPAFPPLPAAKPRPVDPAASRASRGPAPRPVGPPQQRPTPELKTGHAPGVDRSTHDKLKRGQLPIDAKLDLHGMDRDSAHRALNGFLERAHAQGRRCVLVVTGKSGVLKSDTPRWLNQQPNRGRIIAVAQTQPRHGGGGALYVLLKRIRGDAP
jgi:DNA-nicking Smr family endonuclease